MISTKASLAAAAALSFALAAAPAAFAQNAEVPENEIVVTGKGEDIEVCWTEMGGPVTGEPEEDGFGTRMVDMAVTGQLQGRWERRFERDGLVVEIGLSRAAIAP